MCFIKFDSKIDFLILEKKSVVKQIFKTLVDFCFKLLEKW